MSWRNRVHSRLIWRQFDKRVTQTLRRRIVAALRNVDSACGQSTARIAVNEWAPPAQVMYARNTTITGSLD